MVATKLSARLEPSEMRGDVRIGWEDYRAIGQSIRSPRAAAEDAMTYAIWWLAAGTALGYARALLKCPGLKFCCRAHGGWILAGVLLWGGAYLAFPKVDASDTRAQRPGIEAELGFTLRAALMDALGDDLAEVAKRGTLPVELREKARLTVRGAVKESSLRWISTNAFTGRPIREEASPGNYTLFDGEGRLAPQTYDFDGAGNAVR